MMHQDICLLPGNSRNRSQRVNSFSHLFLKSFRNHDFSLNVDLPASQLGCESRILTALPMASDSWSELTMILTRLLASSIPKAFSFAGAKALVIKFRI